MFEIDNPGNSSRENYFFQNNFQKKYPHQIKRLRKIIINGTLDYEEKNQNLRLVSSRIIECIIIYLNLLLLIL